MSGIKEYLDEMEEKAREEAEWNFPTEADYCSTTTDTEAEPLNIYTFPNRGFGGTFPNCPTAVTVG
jgi:hypothetical protein